MARLSQRLAQVKPSPTMAVTRLAADMKAAGRDIIGLGAGEPDFATPPHIRAAAIAAIEDGRTKYTAVDGIVELKQAIAGKFRRENGLEYRTDEISVANGGKQILANALNATLDPGDEVIIPAPYWVSYPDMVRLAGGRPVIVPCPAAAGFKLTAAQLEAAITPATRWLVLNSPSNPTGAAYDRAELAALAAVLMRHPEVWILCDDIYEHLVYDGLSFVTLAQVAPALSSRILICNGVSKAYAMTGWRIGYGAGPAPLIAAMAKLQSQSTSNPCTISQWAVVTALTGPQDCLEENRILFARRRDLVMGALAEAPGLRLARPAGAFYLYPDIAGCIGRTSAGGRRIDDDTVFCTALLEETGVACVAGAAFGLSPHFRLSYATSEAALEAACRRIVAFCRGLG